jgi:hypothetical protein
MFTPHGGHGSRSRCPPRPLLPPSAPGPLAHQARGAVRRRGRTGAVQPAARGPSLLLRLGELEHHHGGAVDGDEQHVQLLLQRQLALRPAAARAASRSVECGAEPWRPCPRPPPAGQQSAVQSRGQPCPRPPPACRPAAGTRRPSATAAPCARSTRTRTRGRPLARPAPVHDCKPSSAGQSPAPTYIVYSCQRPHRASGLLQVQGYEAGSIRQNAPKWRCSSHSFTLQPPCRP